MLTINFGQRTTTNRLGVPRSGAGPAQTETGTIQPWAQPIVDLDTNEIVGAELLARRLRTDGRLVFPDQFLPAMMELDHALALDTQMIDYATSYLAGEGADLVLDFLSVNVDATHISSGVIYDVIMSSIDRSGADPRRLVLEATEHHAHDDHDGWFRNVERLKAAGIRIALDDFGSGFTTMNRLLEAPVDLVKIDMALVHRSDDVRCQALLSGLVDYAVRAQVGLIAEGIETGAQRNAATTLGIRAGQGHLYGWARPLAMLESTISTNDGIVRPELPAPGIRVFPIAV